MMEIIFRGDILPGKNIVDVKESLKARFKLDDAGINKMFSGRPITIKKGLTQEDAEKFSALMQQLGAVVSVKETQGHEAAKTTTPPASETAITEPASSNPASSQPISPLPTSPQPPISEKGTSEPASSATVAQATNDHLTISDVGDDVLREDERRNFTPADIDISDLSLAPDGADVLEDEHKKPFNPVDIDTTHLDLEP